jgi:thymidylate synthase ThyX
MTRPKQRCAFLGYIFNFVDEKVTKVIPLRRAEALLTFEFRMPASGPESNGHSEPTAETSVYAIYGVEPEVQAYAMAKYSRSALSMKESLREISNQKAEKFLNTFYFQYGHRSIADLAHIAFAIEKLSILAAIILVDEQRWDGQERSTRYQDFKRSGYYTPDFGADSAARNAYRQTVDFLFSEYEFFSQAMFEWLHERTPRPEEMKPEAYERTLRARAFDLSRYLLPLATNTSLGQIVNARTLETQISRLQASEYAEVRNLGSLLKQAAREPACNANHEPAERLAAKLRELNPELADEFSALSLRPVLAAPTLVKYADPNQYEMSSRGELRQAARELMSGAALETAPLVDLLDDEPLAVELATSLLYEYSEYSYRQIRERIEALGAKQRQEIIDLGLRHRGNHDEMARAFAAGQKFRFDILMDVGGFRDMHRHRRCIQIGQDFTSAHGFDMPEEIETAGLASRYRAAMNRAQGTVAAAHDSGGDSRMRALYALPLAFRKRTLFKMDFAEAVYISELRTTPAGHFSYRNVAYAMYEAVVRRYPSLAQYFRVTDVREPVDLLKR